jgi:hypothetical protein
MEVDNEDDQVEPAVNFALFFRPSIRFWTVYNHFVTEGDLHSFENPELVMSIDKLYLSGCTYEEFHAYACKAVRLCMGCGVFIDTAEEVDDRIMPYECFRYALKFTARQREEGDEGMSQARMLKICYDYEEDAAPVLCFLVQLVQRSKMCCLELDGYRGRRDTWNEWNTMASCERALQNLMAVQNISFIRITISQLSLTVSMWECFLTVERDDLIFTIEHCRIPDENAKNACILCFSSNRGPTVAINNEFWLIDEEMNEEDDTSVSSGGEVGVLVDKNFIASRSTRCLLGPVNGDEDIF